MLREGTYTVRSVHSNAQHSTHHRAESPATQLPRHERASPEACQGSTRGARPRRPTGMCIRAGTGTMSWWCALSLWQEICSGASLAWHLELASGGRLCFSLQSMVL